MGENAGAGEVGGVEGEADGVARGVGGGVVFRGAGDAGVAVLEFGAVGVVWKDFNDAGGCFDLVWVRHGDFSDFPEADPSTSSG